MKSGLNREQLSAYQGAVEAVLAVPIALGFGYWADRSFDSSPIGLGVGAVIGLAAMVLRITRMRRPDEASDGVNRTTAAGPEAAGRDRRPGESESEDVSTDDNHRSHNQDQNYENEVDR